MNEKILTMKKNRHFHLKESQQGFTLLESLLALFVLTIGLLGVAGMHMQGIIFPCNE